MKDIVLYNGPYIYVPKYNMEISIDEDEVCLYVGGKLMTSTEYCCYEDCQDAMDNIVEGLKNAGFEMIHI